jgi:hypothetical protein
VQRCREKFPDLVILTGVEVGSVPRRQSELTLNH